jgi:hypothetical protein
VAKIVRDVSSFVSSVPARTDVGPFQALIDELEFNRAVTATAHDKQAIPLFETAMFDRCVSEGVLSLLNPALKSTLIETYVLLKQLNTLIDAISNFPANTDSRANTVNAAWDSLRKTQPMNLIEKTMTALTQVLSREN